MAHFAEIDTDTNTVLRVLVLHNDHEHRGQEFFADDLGLGGTWIQTSYNTHAGVHLLGGTPLRGNFAGTGGVYDPALDAFYAQQPYPSWVLNETTFTWEAPTPYPGGITVPLEGPSYEWDEDTTSWVEITE